MNKRPNVRFKAAFLAVIFFAALGASERPAFAQCENADSAIVAAIYGKIKADKNLSKQIRHINVSSLYNVVKLHGWADTRRDKGRIVDFAMNADCVKMVNSNNFADAPPAGDTLQRSAGCGAGMKQCGDLCIPEAEVCNIDAYLGSNFFNLGIDNFAALLSAKGGGAGGRCEIVSLF